MLVHGNRGKCAQPCRLPYELLKISTTNSYQNDENNDNNTKSYNAENNQTILDKGHLLSTKDICSLDLLPTLVNLGINCFKIEGRLKNPEYVATVTRIYRKYIDLALSNNPYIVEEKDRKDLLQVFNRGGFSSGYLENEPNSNLIYKNKPNNMGIFLGTVYNFNNNKGYITLKLQDDISIGDTVSLEKEKGSYTISELMINNKNVPHASKGDIVKIGRIKGKISNNDKIFKMSSKELNSFTNEYITNENVKTKINCKITVKKDTPISMNITTLNSDLSNYNNQGEVSTNNMFSNKNNIYENIDFTITSDLIPVASINSPITKTRIIEQINKLGGTHYEFNNIDVDLDDNLYVPSISKLNQLRRDCIDKLNEIALNRIHRNDTNNIDLNHSYLSNNKNIEPVKRTSILLNILNENYDYTKLVNVDKIYIPLKYFYMDNFTKTILDIVNNFNTYIYMPSILKQTVISSVSETIDNILTKYPIKGFVISNISHIKFLEKYCAKLEFIANYNMNIFNDYSIAELEKLNISCITISPELDKNTINSLNSKVNTEAILYGNLPVMTTNYCLLSKSNSCLSSCKNNCNSGNTTYYLKDRMNMNFRIIPDSFSKTTTIYNTKKTSVSASEINVNFIRLDFIDENIDEINLVVSCFKNGEILEGKEFTNGNFNRLV